MNQAQLRYNKNMNKSGFGIIEIVIATAIIGLMGFAFIQLGMVSLSIAQRTTTQTQAGYLLQEGYETVKFLRDESWAANIDSQTLNTNYFLNWDGLEYQLTQTPQPLIQNRFLRTVRFSEVYRDGSDNISESGTLDPLTKKVLITVSWDDNGTATNRRLEFYLTDLHTN